MPTEQTHTEPNWKVLPGTILDGGYEMEELLEADERRARFKIRVLGDRTIDAFTSLFPVDGTAALEQIEAWEFLRRVPHPNLGKPLAAGTRELDGRELVYVVLRKPDETLNGVLAERALRGEEAREILLNGARTLEHLDRHGLVHGALSPEQVLAVGDSIQLSAEGVRKAGAESSAVLRKTKYVAPESTTAGNTTTAAAIWCLGATVFETLTQQSFNEGRREQAKKLELGWVLERCLDPEPASRCKPEEIPSLLKSGPPPEVALVAEKPAAPAEMISGARSEENQPTILAAAAGAGTAVTGAATTPNAVQPDARPAELSAPKAVTPSLSQARAKVFKQAEFDALTAPQTVPNAGTTAKASAYAAAAGSSLASPLSGASQGGTLSPSQSVAALSRTSGSGAKYDGARAVGAGRAGSFDVSLEQEQPRRSLRTFDAEPASPRYRLWLYAGAGIVLLMLIIWASRTKTTKTTPGAVPATTSSSPAVPGASTAANRVSSGQPAKAGGSAWPTRTLEPDKTSASDSSRKASTGVARPSEAASQPSVASKPNTVGSGGAVWRVVVYTFNRQEDAEKRVRTLNSKHPHLEAQVFSPSGHSNPYLVTVGGRMTREDAARFRSKAMGLGMPRDSYIQNYKP